MNKIRREILAVQILLGSILFVALYAISVYLYIVLKVIFSTNAGVALLISYGMVSAISAWWLNCLIKRNGHFVLIAISATIMLFFFPTLRSEIICHSHHKADIVGWTSAIEDPNTGLYHHEILYVSPFAYSCVATLYARECHDDNNEYISFDLDLFGGEYRGLLFFRNLPPTNFQVFHFVSVIVSGVMYVMILLVIRSKHKTTKQNEI